MDVSVLITTGSIILIGLFFAFGYILRLREFSLPFRRRSSKLDTVYKKGENIAYKLLFTSLISYMVNVVFFGLYIYYISPPPGIELWTINQMLLAILPYSIYTFFILGSVSTIFFIKSLKDLSQMII